MNYHQITFKLAYIHKMIDCENQTRSKSSRNRTEHSAICYAQNPHC